ncbi:MAG: 50S ribosome-binding GTPase [Candidatus Brocadiaceae bacterium]|nr:50S ribosome-binding GTPase [Candidatus Brocadiaceae bacterium]
MQITGEYQKREAFIPKHTTIASIVTPLGEGGIGKIIVSGKHALNVADKVFQGKKVFNPYESSQKLYYGHIHDNNQRLDEVILHVIKKEDSITGLDTIEINCHGGIRVLNRVFECILSKGVEGGTGESLLQQSVVNGSLDFIQAEAAKEIINARTKLGTKVLLDQYNGALSKVLLQGIENLEGYKQSLRKNALSEKQQAQPIYSLEEDISLLVETASFGIALTTPLVSVILGKPNVGKSTIINALLRENQALVHHEPGTTRDYISSFFSIEGIPFEIVDTAGVRSTDNMLESLGMEMTQKQLKRADRIIVIFDNSRLFDREDEEILNIAVSWFTDKGYGTLPKKKKDQAVLPVINKCDLPVKFDENKVREKTGTPAFNLSAKNGEGIEGLQKAFIHEFQTVYKPMQPVVFTRRQRLLLTKTFSLIKQIKDCIRAKKKTREIVQWIDEAKDLFAACLYTPIAAKNKDSVYEKTTKIFY